MLNQIPLHKDDTLLLRFAGRSLFPDKNTGVTKLTVAFGRASAVLQQELTHIVTLKHELDAVAALAPAHGKTLFVTAMYACHHLRFLNNVVHGCGTAGIASLDCDYMYRESNVVYDCAKTSPYGGCGKALPDGNGIIIDSFRQSRANPRKPHYEDKTGPLLPYRGRTLLENNLVYDNGGRGIHVFRSDKVDILNNTCCENRKTPDINAGERTAIESDGIVLANNLAYGRAGKRANTQDGSTRVFWANNLFFHADDVLLNGSTIVGRDPLFVAPALTALPTGFRLRPGSPAPGNGLASIAPTDDLSGTRRPARGPVDIGAYQSSKGEHSGGGHEAQFCIGMAVLRHSAFAVVLSRRKHFQPRCRAIRRNWKGSGYAC